VGPSIRAVVQRFGCSLRANSPSSARDCAVPYHKPCGGDVRSTLCSAAAAEEGQDGGGSTGANQSLLPSSDYLAPVCSRHLPLAAKAPIPASGKGASRRSKSRRLPSRATLGAMQQVQHIVVGPGIRPTKSRAPGFVRGNRQCASLPRYLVIGSRMRAANVERRQDVQPVIFARKIATVGDGALRGFLYTLWMAMDRRVPHSRQKVQIFQRAWHPTSAISEALPGKSMRAICRSGMSTNRKSLAATTTWRLRHPDILAPGGPEPVRSGPEIGLFGRGAPGPATAAVPVDRRPWQVGETGVAVQSPLRALT
jgi:hypothetical protein